MKNWKRVVMYAALTLGVVAGTITLKGSELSVEAAQNEQGITSDFIRGADISSVLSFENAGQKFYYSDGTQGDIFDILQEAGINYVRLRVWNNPYDSVSQKGYGTGFASSTSGNYELLFKDTVQEYSLEDKGSSWDNMAMFDADGKALESLQVFNSLKYSE